jgi:drug/metabolite transporter (DMT)-like permease
VKSVATFETFNPIFVQENRRNYFLLHFIVFIWGWTAILGNVISLDVFKLVWIRLFIAGSGIFAYLLITRKPVSASPGDLAKYLGVGLIVALHWICFYGAIKTSNVSVTLACFSTGSLFTACIEPIFMKRQLRFYEIIFGIMVVGALCLIFGVERHYTTGIILGISAALTSSIFGVLNGVMVKRGHNGAVISLYEMFGGFIGMTIFVLLAKPWNGPWIIMSQSDFLYLLILGIGATTVPFLISLYILKTVSPYTVSLTLNLETLYGIIFAYFIFHENKQLTGYFYIGAAIILSTVFLNGWMKMRTGANYKSYKNTNREQPNI